MTIRTKTRLGLCSLFCTMLLLVASCGGPANGPGDNTPADNTPAGNGGPAGNGAGGAAAQNETQTPAPPPPLPPVTDPAPQGDAGEPQAGDVEADGPLDGRGGMGALRRALGSGFNRALSDPSPSPPPLQQ